jgi:hypothetical protein
MHGRACCTWYQPLHDIVNRIEIVGVLLNSSLVERIDLVFGPGLCFCCPGDDCPRAKRPESPVSDRIRRDASVVSGRLANSAIGRRGKQRG